MPLTAVAAQAKATDGAGALLVTSGLGAEARETHERLAAETGAGVVHAGPGLSSLATAPSPRRGDRHPRLRRRRRDPAAGLARAPCVRWGEAADDVACIGGAILPRWLAPPPDWIGTGIWPSYSLLDLGPE